MADQVEAKRKTCPLMMIALTAKTNDRAFLSHSKCMLDECELWDQAAGRCGLVSDAVALSEMRAESVRRCAEIDAAIATDV